MFDHETPKPLLLLPFNTTRAHSPDPQARNRSSVSANAKRIVMTSCGFRLI